MTASFSAGFMRPWRSPRRYPTKGPAANWRNTSVAERKAAASSDSSTAVSILQSLQNAGYGTTIEEGLPVFVILTRESGEEIRFIHDRMPLILPERYLSDWIRPGTKPEELLDKALTEMIFEKTMV